MESISERQDTTDQRLSYYREQLSYPDLCFYSYLANAPDFGNFDKRLKEVVGRLGFTNYHFARLESVSDLTGMLTTIDKAFLDAYQAEALYEKDIYLRQARNSALPFFQSDLEAHFRAFPDLPEQAIEVKRLSRSFNVLDSYNISVPSSSGTGNATLSVFNKGAPPSALRQTVISKEVLLQLLTDAVNVLAPLKFPAYFEANTHGRPKATRRWHRIVQLLTEDGLNNNQVADKLGVTRKTVAEHLSIAKGALSVKTVPQVIAKAIKLGLVDLNKI